MTFLRNTWYVAAHAHELDSGLVSRKICNEQIVLYRTSTGAVAALEDRCPHRFVPLSMGVRVDDTLRCGYHGLRFDQTGACVEAPNDEDAQKERSCVRAYAAVERYAVIWLWMGERELADSDKIPNFSFFSEKERFGTCQGYSHIKANYELIVDNLLDLSHVHYLHPHIHEGSEFSKFTNEVRLDKETVWSMLWRHHYHVDEKRQALYGFTSDDVEGQGHSRWDAPGVLLVQTAFWEHGKTMAEGIELPSAHLLTPETEFTTHYFWGSGRTFDIHNEAMNQGTAMMMKTVFETQDSPMVEAQQREMGESSDFMAQRPVILRADAAGMMARRLIRRRIKAEAEGADATILAAE